MTAKHGKLLVSVTAVVLNMLLVQVLLQTQCYAQAVWTSLQHLLVRGRVVLINAVEKIQVLVCWIGER